MNGIDYRHQSGVIVAVTPLVAPWGRLIDGLFVTVANFCPLHESLKSLESQEISLHQLEKVVIPCPYEI
jgi:hypothetical protein